jgi:ParB family transcriptional regulator, chromosome partitioning protein
MGKLEELLRTQGDSMKGSLGLGYTAGITPPGMTLDNAQRVPARLQGVAKSKNAVEISVDRIGPDPDQPREAFDPEALERLAASLKTKGQLQPIRVRWDEGRGAYVILCGERRWRAAMLVGLTTMSCVVHEGAVDPGELLALQCVENALREDLKPIEQAKAYKRLMDLHGWSGNQLAKELAIAQPCVVRALALLDLPDGLQAKVEAGELAPRTAYEITKLDDAVEQVALADLVIAERLTGDQVLAAVKAKRTGRAAPAGPTRKEIKLDDGSKITITGPAAAGVEAALAALKRGCKRLQEEIKTATQDQAA